MKDNALLNLIAKLDPDKRAVLIDLLQPEPEPIAIVGMACRFPGNVNNSDEFWAFLRDGGDGITEMPATRWNADALYDPDPDVLNKIYTKHGGFIQDATLFDAGFFSISPREALRMDPQQRLLLEVSWEALENAGMSASSLAGSATGVFIGVMESLYAQRQIRETPDHVNDPYFLVGTYCNATVGRIAYTFDFHGPSMAVDTACSSSLTALHLACQSLRNKESSLALVGGVHIVSMPEMIINLCKMRMLSIDGRCKTLDAAADGFGLSEGCGVVVVKRLKDALADGDDVRAIIRGSALNEDGRSNGLTAPNGLAQEAVIRQALAAAKVDPNLISYVEMHGSGTALGDPIEVEAIDTVLNNNRLSERPLMISSVKTNIGHLTTAAGVAGLIKTVLALQNQIIPPHLHLQNPNPNINWNPDRIRVPSQPTAWQPINGRRLAGVSSFGWSGTNAHVILEEAPLQPQTTAARPRQLILLSAKTETALAQMTQNLAQHLRDNPTTNLADTAYTLQIGREVFTHRQILVCQDVDEAIVALSNHDRTRLYQRQTPKQVRLNFTFMFPGLGDHYINMAQQLYQNEPIFRWQVDRCCDLLQPYLDIDLRTLIYPPDRLDVSGPSITGQFDLRQMLGRTSQQNSNQLFYQTDLSQPATFVIEYALAQLWISWGIKPTALIGYSLGEYVAACLAGVFSLEDGLRLVAKRAQMINTLPEGAMLAVALPAEEVMAHLGKNQISLSAINGPMMCVVAGTPTNIAQLQQKLLSEGIACRPVQTTHAFHSHMMEPIQDAFKQFVQTIPLAAPSIPYISNVTGTWITTEQATNPDYWVSHLRQPVQFDNGLQTLWQEPNNLLLEVGLGQGLSSLALQHPASRGLANPMALPSLPSQYDKQSDYDSLLKTLGRLWMAGAHIDWQTFHASYNRQRRPLPTYPFERQNYWINLPQTNPPTDQSIPETGKKSNIREWFYEPVWQATPLPQSSKTAAAHWLVFEHNQGPTTHIASQLSRMGATVTRVQVGKQFAQLAEDLFTIRLDSPSDYRALLASCPTSTQIVHMWSIDQATETLSGSEQFREAQKRGFYSLLYLAQSIGKQRLSQPIKIIILTNGMQAVGSDSLQPEKATILGPCRVIPQEYQNIRCHTLDVDLPDTTVSETDWATQIIAELVTPTTDVTIAYRQGQRYIQKYQPKSLQVDPAAQPFRSGGVYLITGGLGDVGLALATYLSQNWQANLVLTSRSGLPPRSEWGEWLRTSSEDSIGRKIRKIQQLEAAGSQILVMAADVSDEAEMQVVIDQTHKQFGALHGVIHGAGLTNSQSFAGIEKIQTTICEAHFLSKAHGLYVLDKVLADEILDFRFMLSSLSAILGGLGFVAYAAANAFMDAYAHASKQWISVDWDLWQSTAVPMSGSGSDGSSLTVFEMTWEEGLQAFALAVAYGAPQLVISTGDLQMRLRQWVMLPPLQKTQTTPAIAADGLAMLTQGGFEERIAVIFQEALGMSEIGFHDNFFDLGGNSLVGTQVVSRIQKEFDVQIPVVTLFEAPTVSTLAKYLQPQIAIMVDMEEETLSKRRRQARKRVTNDDIAVVGMNGRFPGSQFIDQLWQNLCNGVESISFFTEEELLAAGIDVETLQNPNYIKARPILENIDQFDATAFGYSPREAELMDPQHRIFLECAWEALELAGYDPERYKGLIGVFAGSSLSTYMLAWRSDPEIAATVNDYQMAMSADNDSLTTTTSYKLNLKGPSFAVQTFCSTSLVAVHLGCQSLANGESDIVLAGGVSLRIPTKEGYIYQEGGMESSDGHCRAFDEQARGTLFGDGIGIVVLKRLADALADNDTIHAVIKGSAINNDGSLKVGFTAPSVSGQAEAVAMALDNANISADTIGYVEAHGTGTELGDPIEVTSLTRAFRRHTDKTGYCTLGSIKTNLGHLERAAGVTGLIKAILTVKHGLIPPTLHYQKPNPNIDFENSPFVVRSSLIEWPSSNGTPRRAGVNSLGIGGTNAHVIVEEPPTLRPTSKSRPFQLLLLSAGTETALDRVTANLAHYLRQYPNTNLADIAYTLQVGRRTFKHRRFLVCQNNTDALAVLESMDPTRLPTTNAPGIARSVAFMFPGVGDHYLQMGRELYEQEELFKKIVERCCQILHPYIGLKIRDLLYSEPAPKLGQNGSTNLRTILKRETQPLSQSAQLLNETRVAQPVVFVIEYALARLLMSWGIQPQVVVGYSLGEYVAACLAGVFSLEDALKVVAERAQMIADLPSGSMLAVSLSSENLVPLLTPDSFLAIHNGPKACVASGTVSAISKLETNLKQQGVACRLLTATHAFHSPLMAEVAEPLTNVIKTISLNPPQMPYLSNVTGTWITEAEATDPAYWAKQMCQPVRFSDVLSELLAAKEQILIEVGPGQSLNAYAKQHPDSSREQLPLVLSTMRYEHEPQSDLAFLLQTVGKLWSLGIQLQWPHFYVTEERRRLPLPTYPFERQSFWLAPDPNRVAGIRETPIRTASDLATLPRQVVDDWFYVPGWQQTAPHSVPLTMSSTDNWLLFIDGQGLGKRIANWLQTHQQTVVIVDVGSAFEQLDTNHFAIRPDSREDYETLMGQLQQQDILPQKIVHAWLVTAVKDEAEDTLNKTLNHGFYSLMILAQVMAEMGLTTYDLSIITSDLQTVHGDECLRPEKATVLGPCRSIPLEYSNVTTRCLDVALLPSNHRQADALVDNVIGEINAASDDVVVALRGYQRWLQTFTPAPLPPVVDGHTPHLKSQGVYLITGGVGGIGLAMAEHLAQQVQAKLILTSRSGLPPRDEWVDYLKSQAESSKTRIVIEKIQHLEALGAEVLVIAADVTDKEMMQSAITRAEARFGPVNGIIHAAGVPGMGLIHLKTPAMASNVLAPKVKGTLVLEEIFQDKPLDFLVLFSSISSFTAGGPGQIDYCAANAFLDAHAQRQIGCDRLTISINWCEWQWDAWQEGLSAFSSEFQDFLSDNRQKYGITFAEGQDALARILARGLPQIITSTQDFRLVAALNQQFTIDYVLGFGRSQETTRTKYARPVLDTVHMAPSNTMEHQITEIWESILGISDIGINDNFFELGGNSLIGLDLVARIQKELKIPRIPAHILYEAPSVSSLAKLLGEDQSSDTTVVDKHHDRGAKRRQAAVSRKRMQTRG
jgi:acyl transferase domain-containing protein/acyl carrier protein